MNGKIEYKYVREVMAQGVGSDSHHASIKKAWKEALGAPWTGDADALKQLRARMEEVENSTADDGTTSSEPITLKQMLKAVKGTRQAEWWRKVREVAEHSVNGKIQRVVIGCQVQADGCLETREIAVQDLFQVTACEACRKVQIRERAKAARERRKKAAAAS